MVKKNENIELIIEDIDFPNKGTGFFEGEKVIVKNAIPGQRILAKISKKRSGHMEGKLVEVIENSEKETEKGCSHFELCGGCLYQRISHEEELKIKEAQVLKLFKNAGIDGFIYDGILDTPNKSGYRNKCEFSFGDEEKGGSLALGMRKRQSRYEVVNLTDCNIIDGDFLKIIKSVRDYFEGLGIPFYHKSTHEGVLRHLVVRKAYYTKEILINLVTVSGFELNKNDFVNCLTSLDLEGEIAGIIHTANDSLGDVVLNGGQEIIYGRDFIMEKLFDLKFKITSFSFFQTNTLGAEVLYSVVRKYLGNGKDKVIFDLYCGTGTIAQIVSENAKHVYGIEIVDEAVNAARENALMNRIENCTFLSGDVLKLIDELKEKPDVIIVDPPRDGINPKAINKIVNFGAEEIIYVSCKPTSLVRDLLCFEESGYKIKRLTIVNQFERTSHVESVCLLKKETLLPEEQL